MPWNIVLTSNIIILKGSQSWTKLCKVLKCSRPLSGQDRDQDQDLTIQDQDLAVQDQDQDQYLTAQDQYQDQDLQNRSRDGL
jgi:hypothetical protein